MKKTASFLVASTSILLIATAFSWQAGRAAAAQTSTVTVFMSTEAWYDETPPCVSLIDCSAVPAATPYPEDSLHVSIVAGQETARTYLAFDVPTGADLFTGTLTLPLDTSAADGSVSPDTAELTACLVTKSFKPVRGSLEAPPPANCHVSSTASYDSKHAAFTVSLAPFASQWTSGTAALALVPSQTATQANATWHTVFYATTKQSKSAPPITASMSVSQKSGSSSGTGTGTTSGPPPSSSGSTQGSGGSFTGSGGGGSFTGGGGLGTFPSTSTSTTTTTVTQSAPQQTTALAPAFTAGFAGPGFAYPLVWALPLVLFVGFAAVGRALTKELYRRDT
jgi:hypothetical protein